jgi:hypothetical protein
VTQLGVKEVSGRERLARLGPVFTRQDLIFNYGMTPNVANVMLSRWHRRDGLVRPLGGRSEVYFNLMQEPNWHSQFEIALKLAVPHAITIGQSAYSHGWTSQLPTVRHLAVPKSVQIYTIEGCQFHQRRREWFIAIAPGIQYKKHTIPELRPAWALADAIFTKAAYQRGTLQKPTGSDGRPGARSVVPDPDEIYVDECSSQETGEFAQAVECLRNFYGFPSLSVADACPTMRLAFATVHAAVLGTPVQELTASPGL